MLVIHDGYYCIYSRYYAHNSISMNLHLSESSASNSMAMLTELEVPRTSAACCHVVNNVPRFFLLPDALGICVWVYERMYIYVCIG